jgi:electron transport complex protein RnfD
MSRLTPVSGPHTHAPISIQKIMFTVMLALTPATAYGIYLYGWPALNLFVITLISALVVEAICLYIGKRPMKQGLGDGSGILSAWLVAMTLPPWAPWWIAVVASICAILLGKQVFGGLGQNVFNPAMLARVIILISFPVQLTTWVNPHPMFSEQDQGFVAGLNVTFNNESVDWDSISTASPLGHVKTELTMDRTIDDIMTETPDWHQSLQGVTAGSLGESSALLLLLGGLFLIAKRIISWHGPVAMLATVVIAAAIFHQANPTVYAPAQFHLLNGALMLAAFFIITDPVTSPNTAKGQIIFGIGCGLLVFIIRTWGSYPEAVGFAVLLMNCFTPLIDHYLRPRIYGRTRKGQPLPVAEQAEEEQS